MIRAMMTTLTPVSVALSNTHNILLTSVKLMMLMMAITMTIMMMVLLLKTKALTRKTTTMALTSAKLSPVSLVQAPWKAGADQALNDEWVPIAATCIHASAT